MSVFEPLSHRLVTKTNNANDLTGLEKFWPTDFIQASVKALGYFDIVVSNAAPVDTNKMWFKPDVTPSQNPGRTYIYAAGSWQAMTEPLFLEWMTKRSGTYNNIAYDGVTGRIFLTANPGAGFDLSDLLGYNGATGVMSFFEKTYNMAPALALSPGNDRILSITPGTSSVNLAAWLNAASGAVWLGKNDTNRTLNILPSNITVDISSWFGVLAGNAAHNNGRIVGLMASPTIYTNEPQDFIYYNMTPITNRAYFVLDPATNFVMVLATIRVDTTNGVLSWGVIPRAQYLSSGVYIGNDGGATTKSHFMIAVGIN